MPCGIYKSLWYRKSLIIMRCILLFLLMGTIKITASVTYSQSVRLSLDVENKSLEEIFSIIEEKSSFCFTYNLSQINANRKATVKVNNETVTEILDILFKGDDIKYVIKDKYIVLYKPDKGAIPISAQQTKIITGTVTGTDGEPIIGANVIEKGTTNGTVTDIDGKYTLSNVSGKVLIFSYIGYISQEITVQDKTTLNIKLQEDTQNIEEVVVVGYGTQKKVSVVGAVTTIEPGKLQAGTTRSMSNNLGGQLSGIIAVQRSGEPGYDNSEYWIRGISSFAGSTNPLVLVDGVERDLNNIDPAEIESFSILKDASASAVYGVRGANGVIIINTKRGKKGMPQVSVRFDQGFTVLGKLPKFVGSTDYLNLLNDIYTDEGKTPRYTQEIIDSYRNNVDPDLYPNVDWIDEVTNDIGYNQRANVTVTGGSDILRYALVGSYYHEKGIMAVDNRQEWDSSSKLSRYNVRSNVDVDITKTTLFRVNIGGYLQDRRRAPTGVDEVFKRAFETPPFVHPTQYSSGELPQVPERSNPWVLLTQTGYETFSDSKIESLFSVEQKLDFVTKGLSAKVSFSFDRFQGNGVTRSKTPDIYMPATGRKEDGSLDLTIYKYGQNFLGYSKSADWGYKRIYMEGSINYDRTIGEHALAGMLLFNRDQYEDGDKLPYRHQGIAGRVSYTYGGRYVAEFNFGYNGSENFAKGARYGIFPSVALGWLLSEESFMSHLKETFSKIKIRASYGLVGNDNIGGTRFAYLTTIGDTNGYKWGADADYDRGGKWEGNSGVSDLTWETVKKANIGLELGLWNALEIQADIFKDRRENIFLQRKTLPSSAGFVQTPWQNFGVVVNKGVDLSINYNKQINQDWFVSGRGTFTYARNKIIEMDESLAVIGTNRAETGHPVNQIFGLIDEGLFKESDFHKNANGELVLNEEIPTHTFSKVRPGDIKYKDINKDGMINDLDKTAIGGTFNPEIVYGFGANARYKNVDFGIFFQGNGRTYNVIGGDNFIPGSTDGAMGNIFDNYQDRWTVDNPSQDVFWPRLSSQKNNNNQRASTWWLHNMSMLRLKNIEIGYNFSKKSLLPSFINSARIYISGSNLIQFSQFKMWDPEVNTANGLQYPIMKSASIGIDVSF